MVKAMRENRIDVTYAVYKGEGLGFRGPMNIFDFFSRVDEFLGKQLGGKYIPWGKIDGSTVEIR